MGDANANANASQKTSKVHAFFKQTKRKQAETSADFKDADVAPKNKNLNNRTDVAHITAPTTTSTMENWSNSSTPTNILGNEFDDELRIIPEIHLDATNTLAPPETDLTDISDEELEYHLANLERESIETIIHNGINGRGMTGNPNQGHNHGQNQDR